MPPVRCCMERLLICGLLDEDLRGIARDYQTGLSELTGNRLALRFPVHITLRGPFHASTAISSLCAILQRVCRLHLRVPIRLNGPVFVDPDLCWFEVGRTTAGFSTLLDLHGRFEKEIAKAVVLDDVPEDFKGRNYRPHVTLGWGVKGNAVGASSNGSGLLEAERVTIGDHPLFHRPVALTGVVENVAIARYPRGWPLEGDVEILESVALLKAGAEGRGGTVIDQV